MELLLTPFSFFELYFLCFLDNYISIINESPGDSDCNMTSIKVTLIVLKPKSSQLLLVGKSKPTKLFYPGHDDHPLSFVSYQQVKCIMLDLDSPLLYVLISIHSDHKMLMMYFSTVLEEV